MTLLVLAGIVLAVVAARVLRPGRSSTPPTVPDANAENVNPTSNPITVSVEPHGDTPPFVRKYKSGPPPEVLAMLQDGRHLSEVSIAALQSWELNWIVDAEEIACFLTGVLNPSAGFNERRWNVSVRLIDNGNPATGFVRSRATPAGKTREQTVTVEISGTDFARPVLFDVRFAPVADGSAAPTTAPGEIPASTAQVQWSRRRP